MANRKVLLLTLVVIYIAFLGSNSYGNINQEADITIAPVNTPFSTDGKLLVAPGVPAIFEITIVPIDSLGTWENLTLALSDREGSNFSWLSDNTIDVIVSLDSELGILEAEPIGEGTFTKDNNTELVNIDGQNIVESSTYLLGIVPDKDIVGLAADKEISLMFENFQFENSTVELQKSFDLKIKESIVTDVKFDPALPVKRLPIDQGGILNKIAKFTIEFNQDPGGVWEKLNLELQNADWLDDKSVVKTQVFRDIDANEEFNANEDALVGQREFKTDENGKDSAEIFLSQSVPKTGVYFLVLVLNQLASVGQEMTLFIPEDGFLFTNARTGPRNGEFNLVIAGEQKVRVLPNNEMMEYVPYESEAIVAFIDIITDSNVKYWTSLSLDKPELISANAVSLISIYRDSGPELRKIDSDDSLVAQVNGFRNEEGQDVNTIDIEFDAPVILNSVGPEVSLDFDDKNLTPNKINHFLLVMKAGTEEKVEKNDRLDAVIDEDSFAFQNRYQLEVNTETATPEQIYAGTTGPSIGSPPETYIDLSDCRSETVDKEFKIDYTAKSESTGFVEFFYTNKNQEELIAGDTEQISVGYIGYSEVGQTKEKDSYIWDTRDVSEEKYYIYARIVDNPLDNVEQEEIIRIITSEDTASAFSVCTVTIVHPLSIRELTPLEENVEPKDGFYLIQWNDMKNSQNASIALYYSKNDLDPNNKLIEYDVEADWKSYKEKLEDIEYQEVIDRIENDAKLITNSIEEDKNGDLGQYNWDLTKMGIPEGEDVVTEGSYYIYAIISDNQYEAAIRSENQLNVYPSTYKPMIKLISPVSESQALRSYTISWIDRDANDDAKISLYYSKELSDSITEFVEDLSVKVKEENTQLSGVIESNISEDLDDNRGFHTWDIDKALSENNSLNEDDKYLTGLYYVYAKIVDENGNTDYSVSPGALLIRQLEIRLNPSIIAVGKDEYCDVAIEIRSPKVSISSVNLYLSYDAEYLDPLGSKPFSIAPEVENIFTEPIRNKKDNLKGHLDYSVSVDLDSKGNELGSDNDFQGIAKVTFKVIKVDECIVNIPVSFDFDETDNRKTSILTVDRNTDEKPKEFTPACFNPALTVQIIPMATISGKVLLETCTDCTNEAELTFNMRKHDISKDSQNGEFEYEILTREVTSKPDGSYMLKDIPSGIWEITVKAPSYLSSQYKTKDGSILLRVVPGENVSNIDFPCEYDKLNKSQHTLIGGDVNNDNRINMVDLSLLSTSFGLSSIDDGFNSNADIDNDGRVIYTDFVILAKNFGEIGAPDFAPQNPDTGIAAPVAPISMRLGSMLKQNVVHLGENFEIPITIYGALELKGFAFEVEYNPKEFRLIGSKATQGGFLKNNPDDFPVLFISKEVDIANDESNTQLKRVITVGIIAGRGKGVSGNGILAKLQFESIAEGKGSIYINQFNIADSSSHFVLTDYKNIYNITSFEIPKETRLMQNYPNPFNPETWIPFTLNADSNVEISIYSQDGQLVKQIGLGYLRAGNYTHKDLAIYWDGKNNIGEKVASGIYFYQLKADTQISPMRKMVILK